MENQENFNLNNEKASICPYKDWTKCDKWRSDGGGWDYDCYKCDFCKISWKTYDDEMK